MMDESRKVSPIRKDYFGKSEKNIYIVEGVAKLTMYRQMHEGIRSTNFLKSLC